MGLDQEAWWADEGFNLQAPHSGGREVRGCDLPLKRLCKMQSQDGLGRGEGCVCGGG